MALQQAPIDRVERFRATSSRFGSLTGEQLTAAKNSHMSGLLTEWGDLCEFFEKSDDAFAGLVETRKLRVIQTPVVIRPGSRVATTDDKLAATVCRVALDNIGALDEHLDGILSALVPGHSFTEIEWSFDARRGMTLPIALHWRHPHRFRFDEQWKPRLYDPAKIGEAPDQYGEFLLPNKWIVHSVAAGRSYPGAYGLMHSVSWLLLFMRWARLFWIENLDRNGQPHIYAEVAPGTPAETRRKIQDSLDRLTSEHTAVFETTDNARLAFETAAVAAGSSHFKEYMEYAERALARRLLGSADAVDAGASGSRAAVEVRTATTADPRMIADTRALWETIRRDLFAPVIKLNRHLFTSDPAIPVAVAAFDDAADEPTADKSPAGAQMQRALEIYDRVAGKMMTRSAGISALVAFFPQQYTRDSATEFFGDVGTDDVNALRVDKSANLAPGGNAGFTGPA